MEWKRKEKTEIWWTLEELSYHWILGSIGDVSMPLLWGNWGSRRGIEATPPLERRRRCYAWVDCSCRSWYCVGFMMDIGFECRRSTTIKSGRRGLVVWWLRMRWACWMALGGGGGGGILGKTIGLLCARATATPQFCSEVDDALRWTSAAPEGPHTASRPSQSISALSILFH